MIESLTLKHLAIVAHRDLNFFDVMVFAHYSLLISLRSPNLTYVLDHVARPLHCSRSIPTSPSGENRSQSFPLASRSLPRNSRHDALPSSSTCFSTLPDRVHHSAVAANSVNYPDVTHCKSRRPPNRRRVKCQRIASTDSCAPSSDEETSSDGDVTSSSSSVAQETPLVAQSLQNNDPP